MKLILGVFLIFFGLFVFTCSNQQMSQHTTDPDHDDRPISQRIRNPIPGE